MPKKYKNRKNNKKRQYKRKQNVPRSLALGPYFPNSLIARHKFCYSVDLSQSYNVNDIGSTNMNNFRINSLRDPDLGVAPSSGGKFKFYDEMGTHYQSYRVIGAKAIIKVINLCQEPVYVHTYLGVQQLSSSTGWTNQSLGELRGVRRRIVHGVNTGAKSVATIVVPYTPEMVEGKKRSHVRGDPNFESMYASDPEELHYLSMCASQVSDTLGSQQNMAVKCEVTILATAIWTDRKIIAPEGGL